MASCAGSIPVASSKELKQGTISPADGKSHKLADVSSNLTPATTIKPHTMGANRQDRRIIEFRTKPAMRNFREIPAGNPIFVGTTHPDQSSRLAPHSQAQAA